MPSRGRILVVLHEPGYFRLYGATIVELGRRGWEVRLAFDVPDKRTGAQVPADAGPEVTSVGAVPDAAGGWLATWRAVVDYVRYLEAPFGAADYLRRRSEKRLPRPFRALTRVSRLPRGVVSAVIGLTRMLEGAVPADARMVAFLRAQAPDVVFVSPVVTLGPSGSRQTEVVKAARALSIPVIVGTASWDHLTSKGLVRVVPDALTVWNDAQVREAVELHRIPRDRVVVTGAQSLDHWFVPVPAASTDAFRDRLGIAAGRRVVLFVGSSRNMAPGASELRFVRRWARALRESSSPALRDALILVRPHPTNTEAWQGDVPPGVRVFPTEYSGIPLSAAEIDDFRQSLLACDAVVGVNTTAMIEAAILDRPVLTVRDAEFDHSQAQTLHFGLLPLDAGGCVAVADSLDDHVRQLDAAIANPGAPVDAARRFVARFVRPLGVAVPATHHLSLAIERVAGRGRQPDGAVPGVRPAEAVASHPGRRGR
jgi:hypothetical protein